jgi:[acyl-carrier-protein] S-malonyltransferase
MNKFAYIYPGQGSQYSGMGKSLYQNYSEARAVFEEADETLHFRLSQTCFEGTEDELKLTHITQPAILTHSIALFRVLEKRIPKPSVAAGHSLGEYSALVSAGSLSFSEAVVTVKMRGEYMQEAVPVGKGAMAAILGMKSEEVDRVCQQVSEGDVVSSANYNAPDQTVIAGAAQAVERAIQLAKERGAKRALKLPVSAPFHCELMKPAQEKLAKHLDTIMIGDLNLPIVTNVDAQLISQGDQARDALIRQVSSPVRWEASMNLLREKDVHTLVEVGPGRVLSGLARRIDTAFRIYQMDESKSFDQALNELETVKQV